MAKNDTIHVRVDENVKINAEQTLAMLGLTISEAAIIASIGLVSEHFGALPSESTFSR